MADVEFSTAKPDLEAIENLTPSNDDILQRKAGAWANRTIAQLKTDLAYTIPVASDIAYDAGTWNGNTDVPTKNAIRDKIETMGGGASIGGAIGSGTSQSVLFIDGSGNLAQDNANFNYNSTDKRLEIFGSDSAGQVHIGQLAAGFGGIWFGQASPSTTNYAFLGDTNNTYLNAATNLFLRSGNNTVLAIDANYCVAMGFSPSPADSTTTLTVLPGNNAYKGIVLKNKASQSGNLLEHHPSGSSTPLMALLPDGGILMQEITAPAAPAANNGVMFMQDSGAGKTQFCVRFATGAVQILATEP